jgi:hypothetical protein
MRLRTFYLLMAVCFFVLALLVLATMLTGCGGDFEDGEMYEWPDGGYTAPATDELFPGAPDAQVANVGTINWLHSKWSVVRVYDPATCIVIYIVGEYVTAPTQTDCGLSY